MYEMEENNKTIAEYLLEEKDKTIKELEILAYGNTAQIRNKRIWSIFHYLVICTSFFGIGYILGSDKNN